ncbi:MAG: tRNA pseudouridine(38-40) synthase TruA [Lentisphaerae bacterium]|nr:tRNA pseudouridine(38-40) synthase TruA [Lentisphaerota bacterium]
MPRYRFDISYDGTAYCGWQIQPNGLTVQEVIQGGLERIVCEPVKLHGSGRTDQGVHARRQVAHADLPAAWDVAKLRRALNAVLPPDIRIMRALPVSATFHARKSVMLKEYRYFIWNGVVLPPDKRFTFCHIREPLNVAAMQEAADLLVGQNDFAAFSANPNRFVETTVRRLDRLDVRKRGAEISVIAAGEGFLYKMVRSLVGFLIRVGEGSVEPALTREILASGERTARVPTAAPQGLFLWNVTY